MTLCGSPAHLTTSRRWVPKRYNQPLGLTTEAEADVGRRPRVRITSRCSTQDEFVAVYRQYCDERSIFIATKTPKPRGATLRFAVTLADGDPLIVGVGRVAESHADEENPYKRPGMRIEFIDLEDASRTLVHRLHSARRLAAATPPSPPGAITAIPIRSSAPPPDTRIGEGSDGGLAHELDENDDPTDVRPTTASAQKHPPEQADEPGPKRAKGSDLVLPANPFGEVDDQSLAGFIDCTIYEEEGAVVLPPEEELERQLKWLNRGATGTPPPIVVNGRAAALDPVESALDQVESAIERVRRRTTLPPAISEPVASEPDEARPDSISPPPRRTTAVAPPMPADRRSPWKPLVIACTLTTAIGLATGYLLWGDSSDPDPVPVANAHKDNDDETDASDDGGETGNEADDETEADRAGTEPNGGPLAAETTDPKPAQTEPQQPEPTPFAPDTGASNDDPAASGPELNTGAPAGECNATIRSRPDGATVRLNGAMLGETPLVTGVACGSGLLKIASPRYQSVEKRVELVEGENELDVRLQRPIHALTVTSNPAGARVTVNGRSIGRTPAKTTVKGFERVRIRIEKPGYKRVSKRVYMKRASARVHSRLERQRR